ncbi:MAG: pyruvate dehydrogenase (acetyl-transferring) E1 component subunit alpha [Microbacteriaceae bacterium]|nr:pyruvate dehydrogenase (acetyl-transferring) E1 component subunit alpha [Microbacteriaceae bacterium]
MSDTTPFGPDWRDPEPIRFLDDEGRYAPSATAAEFAAELEDVDLDQLKQWYLDMATVRAFDIECTHLQRQGQLALWAPSMGQEGGQVGIAHAALPQDHLFPTYREHTVAHVRGVQLSAIAGQFRGVTHGGWDVTDPANGNCHLYTLVLGAQTQHASGFALSQVLDAKRAQGDSSLDPGAPGAPTEAATIAFYGDGTTSQGDVNESMVFAASFQAPLVHVMQNNGWAISVPAVRQSRTPFYRRALGFGLRAVQIDGNDPLAGYAVAKRFLDAARSGEGPGYIEALTYRMGAHTTSDDPTRYRESDEVESWREKDPVVRFETYLRELGADDEFFEQTAAQIKAVIAETREAILTLPEPDRDSMFAHVYSEPHPVMTAQREWLDRYEASFGGDA